MSTLTKTYTFTALTTAQAGQVNTNFDDIISYINTECIVRDAAVAFTAIPTLPASNPSTANQAVRKQYIDTLLNATGMRIVANKTAYAISGAEADSVGISFGITFASAPFFIATVKSDSNVDLGVSMNGGPSTTGVTVRVWTQDGGTTTKSGDVHWLAIGSV